MCDGATSISAAVHCIGCCSIACSYPAVQPWLCRQQRLALLHKQLQREARVWMLAGHPPRELFPSDRPGALQWACGNCCRRSHCHPSTYCSRCTAARAIKCRDINDCARTTAPLACKALKALWHARAASVALAVAAVLAVVLLRSGAALPGLASTAVTAQCQPKPQCIFCGRVGRLNVRAGKGCCCTFSGHACPCSTHALLCNLSTQLVPTLICTCWTPPRALAEMSTRTWRGLPETS